MENNKENILDEEITDSTDSEQKYEIEQDLFSIGEQVKEYMSEMEEENSKDSDFLKQELESVTEDPFERVNGEIDPLSSKSGQDEELHNEDDTPFLKQEPELEEINDSLAWQINSAILEDEAFSKHMDKKRKRKRVLIITSCVLAVLVILLIFLLGTKHGQKAIIKTVVAPGVYDEIFNYEETVPTVTVVPPEDSANSESTVEEPICEVTDDVVNILLVGVEEIENAQNTDVLIIASMNRTTNELSIISLMRDLYVKIPGHNDNKLNAAFALGGMQLLNETIRQNFGVDLDGYIMVNFKAFEKIVDLLGGVTITLTNNEAEYLNSTNYISEKYNRNVRAGTQKVNGNQAVGYCRIRYVSTGKESNDFGRTARHRAVLDDIYKQLMSKNIFQLLTFMNQVFENVQFKTDISKNRFSDYLTEVVDLKIGELKQHRIPENHQYIDDKVYIGEHKQWVLLAKDWAEIQNTIHEYIYGSHETDTTSDMDE